MRKNPRAFPFFLFPMLILILSLLYPAASARGVREGLRLVTDAALGALFPALVLSRLLCACLGRAGGRTGLFLPLLLGLVSGLPVGAVAATDLARRGVIRKGEAERMLFFCNNPGPAFLVGYCGKQIFGSERIGWLLFGAQSALAILSFFFFFYKELSAKREVSARSPSPPLSRLLTESIREAGSAFFYLACCILFFSFLTRLVCTVGGLAGTGYALTALFFECTGGVGALKALPRTLALPLCGAGVGWAGLSVHFQTLGVLSEASLSPRYYFAGKAFFALFLAVAVEIFKKCL
ncbi:MAG: hypothetical protein IKC69_00200 [Clostridia bacterium]|nr:hypothetical protein [Clostridia bacterium]